MANDGAPRLLSLQDALDALYRRYNRCELIKPDPLQFVYRYSDPADMEIAGFLAAVLAYGRVAQIEKSLDRLLGKMGKSPAAFVRGFDKTGRKKLQDFRHRFNTGDDISDLCELLRKVLEDSGNLEQYFLRGYRAGDANIIGALSDFCNWLLQRHAQENNGRVGRGLKYLISDPAAGSAAKRLNLFLRWMIRDDNIDTGLWKRIDKAKLLVPVDVHMCRISRILNLHNRKNISIKTAVEVTNGFAEIEPTDPVKYDFALCRVGMVSGCNNWQDLQDAINGE
jgi:uncharacterized protein (TIGR02757 family)